LLVAVYFLPSFLVVAIGKGQLQNRHPKARQYFLPHLTDCVIFRANKNKVAENALRHMLLKLIIDRV
jgi:hypothetical protein